MHHYFRGASSFNSTSGPAVNSCVSEWDRGAFYSQDLKTLYSAVYFFKVT